jgi:hypothetical protein
VFPVVQSLNQEHQDLNQSLVDDHIPSSLFDVKRLVVAGDRMLDADEILHAFEALEASAKAAATGCVPFSTFTPEVQEKLAKFDETGVNSRGQE